ncbi:uncharacterized protein DFL_003272 [Arthrobotrys flagrans]|uniref:Uncharacterized protein n=1 Tax=Arthrobotrys flagrans TaxID=97331 RepID=A0A437A1D4_ARTFL|nr:hypothetical protein DFL_003272 [Arthrobotrys flagrans]
MSCQQSNELLHSTIFAIKTKRIYSAFLVVMRAIEPALAYEIRDVSKAQKDLKGEYTFSYNSESRCVRLDMPIKKPAHIGPERFREVEITDWPWDGLIETAAV